MKTPKFPVLVASVLAGALLGPASVATAATSQKALASGSAIYVAPAGDDAGNGSSARAPVKTLQRALTLATGGQTVYLGRGDYAWAREESTRTAPVTVKSYDGPARVAGLNVNGGQDITFDGITFVEGIRISMHVTRREAQPTRNVTFVNSDISSAKGSHCVVLRDRVERVTFRDNNVHDCRMAFAGAGGAAPSSKITIEHNNVHDVFSDGIQFGDWSDVVIKDNIIRDIRDPEGVIHNDAIQLTGDSRNVLIEGNTLARSSGQLIILQANVGPVENVRIVNNVLTESDAIPIQSFGVSRLTVAHNTIWFGNGHGVLIRSGGGVVGTDVAVVDNLVTAIETYGGGKIAYASGNVTSCPRGEPKVLPVGVAKCLTTAPDFLDPARLNFRLGPLSPLRGTVRAAAADDFDDFPRTAMTAPGAFG